MVRQFGCCVERLAPRCGQLKAKGADVAIGSLTRSPGLHLAFIHGPEGVMVELVQRLDTQAIRVFEGTLKAHELLDACSCGSVTGRPHGNRIGHDRERGLQGRLAQEMAAQLIHPAPSRYTWRSKAIQAAAHEDRTRSEGVCMRSAGHAPAGH
jgi:hypothetical protein